MLAQKNEKITQTELIKRLGINKNTFSRNRERILNELKQCCEYTIKAEGSALYYTFLTDCNYFYCKDRSEQKKKDSILEKAIQETIKKYPLNTARNITRIITSNYAEIQDLEYSSETYYKYTRLRVRLWYGSAQEVGEKGYIADRVYCRLENEEYIPMDEKEIQAYVNLYGKQRVKTATAALLIKDAYEAGTITEDEYLREREDVDNNCYISTRKAFKDIYGYYPILANQYVQFEFY